MPYVEIPSDDEVVKVLRQLGNSATAVALCNALVADGHVRRDSQLAIQRATERGRIALEADWKLSVPQEVRAA